MPFGIHAGLGLYFSTVDRPGTRHVVTLDIELIIADLSAHLGGHGRVGGHWLGAASTAVYVYGPDIAVLRERLLGFMANSPLASNAELVPITPVTSRR